MRLINSKCFIYTGDFFRILFHQLHAKLSDSKSDLDVMSKVNECKHQDYFIANFKNHFDDSLPKFIQPYGQLNAKIAVSKGYP